MGLTRKRTFYVVAFVALVVLSLRPVEAVERAFGFAVAPARVLGEIALPFGWVRAAEVRAAEEELGAELLDRRAQCLALIKADQAAARPTRPDLVAGRLLIHTEVAERFPGDRDHVVVELPASATEPSAGQEPPSLIGLPVVRGDHFVGRVVGVDAASRRATIRLVTDATFRIGAEVHVAGEDPSWLVVGGLAPSATSGPGLVLAAHQPSRRDASTGDVVVAELDPLDPEDLSWLANGYRLGELVTLEIGGARVLGVRPGLDYKAGLYQLIVLAPAGAGAMTDARGAAPELWLDRTPFEDDDWTWAEILLPGTPSPGREARKLAVGSVAGIEAGAAALFGARFVGRVQSVQAWTADLAFLGDPGLELAALAEVDGLAEPFALGRLVGLGRGADGALRLRWEALVPLPAEAAAGATGATGATGIGGPVPARVFTGSGQRGVPRGLFVGDTLLPQGEGPHVLRIASPADVGALVELQVRRARPWSGGAP